MIMFSFFRKNDSDSEEQLASDEENQSHSSEPEEQEEAAAEPKSMKDYYDDLEAIIADIREKIKDADKDPAFRHAAKVLTEVIELCRDIESSINPITVIQTNSERSKLLKTLGPKGLIEVKGEASKLLVTEYRKLMIALANKEYWPNAPALFAPIVHGRYESELEKRAEQTQQRIQEYQNRIDEYEKAKAKANEQPKEVKRRRR
jgi:hypothetical protein